MGSIKWPKDQEGRSHSKMLTAVIGTIITLTMVVGLFERERERHHEKSYNCKCNL